MIWIFVPAGCHIFFRLLGCVFAPCCSAFFLQSNLEQLRHGQGSQCEMCPPNYFKNDTHAPRPCMPCPEGSTAPRGSTSHENCKCEVGELFEKDGELKLDRTKYLTAVRCPPQNCTSALGMSERSCNRFTMLDGGAWNTWSSGPTLILLSLYGYQCFLDSFSED